MSEERKGTEEREDQKEDARDLEPKKDAKGGGGGFGKQSPSGGGDTTDPHKPIN